jgi:AcrR family transcriptional regulator
MPAVKSTRRPYRSEHRRRQADATRATILDAARWLFPERGYSRTTIEAIAEAAGVAGITVYTTFGSKRALLADLIHIAVVGDEQPAPVIKRDGPRQTMALPDQREQIHRFANDVAGIMERVSPLLEVLGHAALAEPDMAKLNDSVLSERLGHMKTFARAVRRNGAFREGISSEKAGEIIWALTSAEMVRLLMRRLGWSRAQYADWLERTLVASLITARVPAPRSRRLSSC